MTTNSVSLGFYKELCSIMLTSPRVPSRGPKDEAHRLGSHTEGIVSQISIICFSYFKFLVILICFLILLGPLDTLLFMPHLIMTL